MRISKNLSLNLIYIFSFLLFTTVCAVGQDVEAEKQKAINQALQLLEGDKPSKAIEVLTKAVAANPTDAPVLYYLGYVQLKAGKLDEAFNTFDKGTKLNEKEGLNYAGKGYAKILQGKPAEAKPFLDNALAVTKSKNPSVLNAVAEAYIENKQAKEATDLLLKSKGIKKDNAQTQLLLGDAYLQQNNGGSAMSSYEAAADLNPKSGTPQYKIGVLYIRSRNLEAAEKAFDKAISVDPSYARAYKELGALYYARKDGAKAVKAQESYLSLAENSEEGKTQLAFYYFMAKDYAKANELFSQLVQSPTATPTTFRFYGKSLFEAGDFHKSREIFEQYIAKAKPEDIEASDYAYLGDALFEIGNEQRAAAAQTKTQVNPLEDSLAIINYNLSLELDSANTDVVQKVGDLLYKKKRYAEAIVPYKSLLTLRQKPSLDYFNLGRAYYYNDQLVEADSAFNKLIELQPTMPVGYLWVARVKASQDPESTQGLAKPYFDKVIEIASANPTKNKNDLVEGYRYLGYYYYIKKDNATSKSYWQKVLGLIPNDPQATEAIGILNKLNTAQKKQP